MERNDPPEKPAVNVVRSQHTIAVLTPCPTCGKHITNASAGCIHAVGRGAAMRQECPCGAVVESTPAPGMVPVVVPNRQQRREATRQAMARAGLVVPGVR